MSRGQGLVSFFQIRASSRSLLAAPVFKRSASSLESEPAVAPEAYTSSVKRWGRTKASPAHNESVNGINNCPDSCLCSNNITIDYKNVRLLSQFISSMTGLIIPNSITKICGNKQRKIAKAIKRARTMGFMPYTSKLPQYFRDPKLF